MGSPSGGGHSITVNDAGQVFVTWAADGRTMIAVRSGGSWSNPEEFAPYAGQTAMAAGGTGTPRVLLGRGDAVYEATGDDRAIKHYVAGSRVATRVDGELYYIIPDHGHPSGALARPPSSPTPSNRRLPGTEVGRAIYDPYGGVLTSTIPLTVTDRLFTGKSQRLFPRQIPEAGFGNLHASAGMLQ